jgi:hypothetical protein
MIIARLLSQQHCDIDSFTKKCCLWEASNQIAYGKYVRMWEGLEQMKKISAHGGPCAGISG